MKKVKLFFCFLSLFLLGGMVSCSSDDTATIEIEDSDLAGAWLEDGDNGIIVFEVGGKFKSYKTEWDYTADIESYSYGTWQISDSRLTLIEVGKYENGTPDKSFVANTETFSVKGYHPHSVLLIKENGERLVFYKYTKMSIEQYLKQYLVGKWSGGYELKSDDTFTTFTTSREYGSWYVTGETVTLTLIVEGYYDVNNNKKSYDSPKVLICHVSPLSADEVWLLVEISEDPTLDQGGGSQEVAYTTTWGRIKD